MPAIDTLWQFTVHPLELVLRGSVIYVGMVLVLRFVLRRNLRKEWITPDELAAKLREQGFESAAGIEAAYLESSGELSIVSVRTGDHLPRTQRRTPGSWR